MSCCMPNSFIHRRKIIPLKVRDVTNTKRIGIVVKSVSELRDKARKKLQVHKRAELRFVDEEDGTEIDDDTYLQELAPHTVLVALTASENWDGRRSLIEQAFNYLLRASQLPSAYEDICSFMDREKDEGKLDLLGRWAANVGMNAKAERRSEDPQWFSGVPEKFKTKESFLREKARARIRGYLYHTKDYISKTRPNGETKRTLDYSVCYFLDMLRKQDYQSDFFARSCQQEDLRLCNPDGWFTCEGPFDRHLCPTRDHRINPYGSRECRILFSTWDLDHGIEKSRAILPCLLKAASQKEKEVNLTYFYRLLFTRENLKIVHPVCHDKSEHKSAKCDPQLIFSMKIK